jgi:hypothetical protein
LDASFRSKIKKIISTVGFNKKEEERTSAEQSEYLQGFDLQERPIDIRRCEVNKDIPLIQ